MLIDQLKRTAGAVVLLSLVLLPISVHAAAIGPARGLHAVVASQDELASAIGIEIMKKGGNAVDAAIAVGIALAVVYPEAGNIGGGGFMLIRLKDGTTRVIDYRESAPAAATRRMFIGQDEKVLSGEGGSLVGYRASGVPGTLAGFELAFKKYGSGRVKWRDLVEPARKIALTGFTVTNSLTKKFAEYKETLSRYPDSRRILLNNGRPFAEGDRLRQPELAETLRRIESLGPREFYAGRTARMIAADMKANGGLITLNDLRAYRAVEREPLRGTYRGYQVISAPPPSSGGIVLTEGLNMLESFDIKAMRYNSAATYHISAEAMRRAFADRAEFMGDPAFSSIPVAGLLSKAYAKERGASIDLTHASKSSDIGHGEPLAGESIDTTNFAVIDPRGNAVINSYTINDLFGSRVIIKGTGVLMNDEMDDFAAQPGTPNVYGLIQGERNAIAPGKRPLSSMCPTIVLRRDGSFWFGAGARGGPRIISAVLQIVMNVIDHDMDIQAAIDAPRVHHQWLPDEMLTEPDGISPDTLNILSAMGHRFAEKSAYVAAASGVMLDDKGIRMGAVDRRSDGRAVAY
jgi:gamma-glutamyltranspeptidase/glutathione hydrolase